MESFQTIAIVALCVSNLVLAGLLLALGREVGVILTRMGPTGPRPMPDAAPFGMEVEHFNLVDVAGQEIEVKTSERAMLLFVSVTCPSCAELMPGIAALVASPPVPVQAIAIACGDKEGGDEDFWGKFARMGVPFVIGPDVCARFGIQGWPYALLFEEGKVRFKGLVNNLQHLEGLFHHVQYVARNGNSTQRVHLEDRTG